MSTETCPECLADMQGDPVPEKYRIHADDCPKLSGAERCFCFPYGEQTTHFSRLIGIEVRGVYDGILYWVCPDCGHAWPRALGFRDDIAARYAAEHNARTLSGGADLPASLTESLIHGGAS